MPSGTVPFSDMKIEEFTKNIFEWSEKLCYVIVFGLQF